MSVCSNQGSKCNYCGQVAWKGRDKVRNILDELRYNIRKNSVVNLILIVQFVIFFWQSTIISSYFLDMPTTFASNNLQKDAAYYSLFYYGNAEDINLIEKMSMDPDYIENLGKTYREIHENPENHYMVIRNVDLKLDYDELSQVFTDEELLDFCVNSLYSGYYNPSETKLEEVMPTYNIGEIQHVFENQIKRIDYAAMKHFNLQVSEGRLLNEEDFIFHKGQKVIPVLLGSVFAKGYHAGDVLHGYLFTDTFDLKIVGILEENTAIATDQILETDGQPYLLDYGGVIPYFYMKDMPETDDERIFTQNNYEEGLMGTIAVDLDMPRTEVNKITKRISEIFVKNGLYPVNAVGTSYGVTVFQQESERTMKVFLGASMIMGMLGISGICMSVITKLNRNLHRYGIEIMNGQSVYSIMWAFLLEIAMTIGAAMLFTIWRFMDLIMGNVLFLIVILILAFTSVFAVSLIFIRKLFKVDIEKIVRSEE